MHFISCLRADEAALGELVRRVRALAPDGTGDAGRDLQAMIGRLGAGGAEPAPGT